MIVSDAETRFQYNIVFSQQDKQFHHIAMDNESQFLL